MIVKLKKLLSRRDFLVRHKQSTQATLHDQQNAMDPDLFTWLKTSNDVLIKEFNKQIKEVENRIEKLLKSNEHVDKNYGLAKSVIGIGLITAAYMIAVTDNFTCFSNSRKFA